MATDADVSTDWQRSAGSFSCVICGRKRLPASEFSKKQVEKALEALNSIADKDIRDGPEIERTMYLSAVCKKCTEAKEEKERMEAAAKREAQEKAVEEAEMGPAERVTASLAERPMGMQPSKADVEGYVVAKVTEGKPAFRAGVRLGWRVVAVAGEPCTGMGMEAVQALLKSAALPVEVEFEAVPSGADFCTACQQVLVAPSFSRKMRTKPPDKRRCIACVEASEAAETAEKAAASAGVEETGAAADRPQSKLSELQALCAESATQAEKVTGLKPTRGGGYLGRGGRARGRGRH